MYYLVTWKEYNELCSSKSTDLKSALELSLKNRDTAKLFSVEKIGIFRSIRVELNVNEEVKKVFPEYRWDIITTPAQPTDYFLERKDICKKIVNKVMVASRLPKEKDGGYRKRDEEFDWNDHFFQRIHGLFWIRFSNSIAKEIIIRKRKKIKKYLNLPVIADLLIDVESIDKVIRSRCVDIKNRLAKMEDKYQTELNKLCLAIFKREETYLNTEEEKIFLEMVYSKIVPFRNIFGYFFQIGDNYSNRNFLKIE